jgi:hypothetical protein
MDRPLLLVDIDGVLSLFGFEGQSPPQGRLALIEGMPHLLSSQSAGHLRVLADLYECAWCSGWEERADEHLPHLLDLPRGWPHVPLDGRRRGPAGTSVAGHWKLAAIDAFAGRDRPLAWIDDALDDACHAWAAARPGPTLLVPTQPAVGLTAAEAQRLAAWVTEG